jgi:hypothetical protein
MKKIYHKFVPYNTQFCLWEGFSKATELTKEVYV